MEQGKPEDRKKFYMLTVRRIQLEERHKTIMEAWDEKSKSKTNLKLKTMYNDLWEELNYINEQLNQY